VRPVLFSIPFPWIGPLAIKAYGVMLMLGFLAGLGMALRRARKENVNQDIIWDFWLCALLGGIVGSRALYIFQHLDQFSGRILDVFKIWEGGLSFYGGFALAVVVTWIMLRMRRMSVLRIYDIMAVSIVLGLAFGKVGCFLNGCCFGKPTEGVIAVTYPTSTPIDGHGNPRMSPAFKWQVDQNLISADAPRSLPVHPVQLYESAAAFTIMLILLWFYPHRRRYGEVTCLFGTLYPIARFSLEFFRQRQAEIVPGFSPEQIFSVVAFVAFATVFIISRKSQPAIEK